MLGRGFTSENYNLFITETRFRYDRYRGREWASYGSVLEKEETAMI